LTTDHPVLPDNFVQVADQLDTLRALGCQFGQGYYFSQPVPAEPL
jgi:EAL domain-containing protein (putative c-di-GMP-specific phosphodiesterase class I)